MKRAREANVLFLEMTVVQLGDFLYVPLALFQSCISSYTFSVLFNEIAALEV